MDYSIKGLKTRTVELCSLIRKLDIEIKTFTKLQLTPILFKGIADYFIKSKNPGGNSSIFPKLISNYFRSAQRLDHRKARQSVSYTHKDRGSYDR
jgi:hypothetical protein